MKTSKLSIFLAVLIVCYGTYGKLLLPDYQYFIEQLLSTQQEFLSVLMEFFKGTKDQPDDAYNLGKYLIYMPSYLGLHLLFINVLFLRNVRQRNKANLIFFGVAFGLVICVTLARMLHFVFLFEMVINLISKLIALPLILFLLEGGRLLLGDIDRMMKRSEDENIT